MELDWQEDASNRHYENWRGQDFKDSISTRKSKFDLHAEFFKNFEEFFFRKIAKSANFIDLLCSF